MIYFLFKYFGVFGKKKKRVFAFQLSHRPSKPYSTAVQWGRSPGVRLKCTARAFNSFQSLSQPEHTCLGQAAKALRFPQPTLSVSRSLGRDPWGQGVNCKSTGGSQMCSENASPGPAKNCRGLRRRPSSPWVITMETSRQEESVNRNGDEGRP